MQNQILLEPAFIGRKQELAELDHYLELATKGKGTAIFVSGEAGTGKTRLITEFSKTSEKQGVKTLIGYCLSNAPVPYFPFFEAFNTYFSEETNMAKEIDLSVWLKGPTQGELSGKKGLSPRAWKDQTFAAVSNTLTIISKRQPIILIVEDVHWADSASLALIHYIARSIKSEKVLLVATFRSEEITADVEGRPHPLLETLRLMKRENLIKEVRVTSLDQKDILKLAKSMLGGELQQELAEKLIEESQGNPLFAVESLKMLHERNGLLREDNKWKLARDELEIPDKIKDIVLQRLGPLLRSQRRIVEAASVIGGKFSAEILASMLGLNCNEVIETVDFIGQTTSLLGCEGKLCLVQFDHARTRDAIYEEISPALKRIYHVKVAETLEEMFKGVKLPFSELAYHYDQAGDKERAIKYSLVAGQDALARWSNTEAIKHFTYVLNAVEEDPKWVEERISALEGLGDGFYADNMFKEAAKIYEDLANMPVTDIVRLRAYRKAMDATDLYGDLAHEMELVKKAEVYAAADRLENARILSNKGRCLILQVKVSAAKEAYEEALQVLEEEYALSDVAKALLGMGAHHAVFTNIDSVEKQGLSEILRGLAIYEDLGDFWYQMQACHSAGFISSLCLHDLEALDFFRKLLTIDENMKMGDYLHSCYAQTFMARSFWGTSDFDKALAYSLEALKVSEKTDSDVARAMIYGDLVVEYASLGYMKRSEEYFEKLTRLPQKILTHGYVQTSLAKAVILAVKNQWKESNQIFEKLKLYTHTRGYAVRFKLLYAWALEKQGQFEKARLLRQEVQREYREADERIAHASVQANLMARRQVLVGEEFEMRFDLANIGRKNAVLIELQNVPLECFQVTSLPSWCDMRGDCIGLNNKEIGPFQVNTVKLTLKSLKAGTFTFNPMTVYIDDLNEKKTCSMKSVCITAYETQLAVPAGRVSSGLPELDDLLMGGIPEKYSVILLAPSCDERELLIKRFLETSTKAGQPTLYLTTEAENANTLAKKYPIDFSAIVCGPRADIPPQKLLNIYQLKGVENLTEINIALTKYFRTLHPSKESPRIACIQIVSDVLLQHGSTITRKWLSEVLANLRSAGFTSLAVMDSTMHPSEDTQAMVGLFDIDMRVSEKEDNRVLKIRKFRSQKYLKKELILNKD